MQSNSGKKTTALLLRGFAALWAVLVLAAAFGARPAAAAPFAYVTNQEVNQASGTVSVIDTATNKVVATVGVGPVPFGVAVTPDGKRAYVTNNGPGTVSVIDTATNTVVGLPIPLPRPGGGRVRPTG